MVVQKSIGLAKEFREFLKEYKVIGLAVAVIMGFAANTMIKSLVDNIIMPLITPFIPGGAWQTAVWNFWVWKGIAWGSFLSALIYFLIIALVVFLISKFMLKEEKVTKK
ncbi:MAG: MscL family protein [archaeon]